MSWPPYSEYTASGTEWLDTYPATWVAKPLKAIASMRAGSSITSETIEDVGEFPVYGGNGLRGYADAFTHEGAHVLIGRVGALCGNIHLVSGRYWASEHAIVTTPNDSVSPQWLAYMLETMNLGQYSQAAAQPVIATDVIGKLRVPTPSPAEQRAIVGLLNTECGKIDALIGKQELLIATLREDRTATITHAITKGLGHDVEMAPSGFPGLPLVPTGWAVTPLKHVCLVRDCKHVTAEFVDDGFPLGSIREVQSRYVDLSDAKQTTEDYYQLLNEGGRRPKAGDLIFSRNATVGEVAEVPSSSVPFAMGQDVCLLRPELTKVGSAYTWYALRSGLVRTQIDVMMIGSTFKRINVEEIRSLVITLPPSVEQQRIVAFLDERCAKIDALISKANDVIETMREYRSALVTDAVTGKIDVRGAA